MNKFARIFKIVLLSICPRIRFVRKTNRFYRKSVKRKASRACMNASLPYLYNDSLEDINNEELQSCIEAADKILANTFNYLGSGDKVLTPINWSQDFKSGHEWPKGTFYMNYIQVSKSNNADVKVPREICRFHFLLHLAFAYHHTKDKRYADKSIDLIIDWIEQNPLMYSINWGCAMDVAIRATNWIWGLSLLKDFEIDENKYRRICESLYEHGWFIYRNLEGNIFAYNNNHYLSDIVGLLHIGQMFIKDKKGKEWFDYAQKELFRETRLQVLPSGMTYERTTNYHRLVLELILTSVIFLRRTGHNIPADINSRLECMFEFVKTALMPNGEMPIIGDQDNGRILPWGTEDTNDYRYLMSLGATLYNRADFKSNGNGYNIYCCIFGEKDSREEFEKLETYVKNSNSCLLRDAGFALMKSADNYLIFNADNCGMYSDTGTTGSHTHCDWYSFVLAAKGVPFIIDPGTYVYSSDFEKRNLFRSTAMHNTIVIDSQSQEELHKTNLWAINHYGKSNILKWISDNKKDTIVCEHTGYTRLKDPAIHRRGIDFDKLQEIWTIKDNIEGSAVHNVEYWLHLASGVKVVELKENNIILENGDVKINIQIKFPKSMSLSKERTEISRGYGNIEEGTALKLSGNVALPAEITTNINII